MEGKTQPPNIRDLAALHQVRRQGGGKPPPPKGRPPECATRGGIPPPSVPRPPPAFEGKNDREGKSRGGEGKQASGPPTCGHSPLSKVTGGKGKRLPKQKRKGLSIVVDNSNAEQDDVPDLASDAIPSTAAPPQSKAEGSFASSGAFNMEGFEIKEIGITGAPDLHAGADRRLDDPNKNLTRELIKLSVLGRGASGVVYKGVHVPTMRLVAIKTIPVFDHDKRQQMIKELKALYANLAPIDEEESAERGRHGGACPHIVAFYDAFIDPKEGNISIVVEYMDGGSLQDIVDTGGCGSESVLANISYRVLMGLAFIHDRRQIHRDIKPSNLLINHMGDVKISDFGIVRELESTHAQANTFVGTLTYMSPERISGEEYGYSSDMWSFGLSLMTCALGEYPLSTQGGYWGLLHSLRDEPAPRLRSTDFSSEFCDFLNCCLQKDPAARSSARTLLQHGFVAGCTDILIGRQASSLTPEGSETARRELDEICDSIMQHHYDNAVAGAGRGIISTCEQRTPQVSSRNIAMLSHQLGLPPQTVKMKFETKINELSMMLRTTGPDGANRKNASATMRNISEDLGVTPGLSSENKR